MKDKTNQPLRNLRSGRMIRIQVEQAGHREGVLIAPWGVNQDDSSYDEMGGDSIALVDPDGVTIEEKIALLNESLDDKLRQS